MYCIILICLLQVCYTSALPWVLLHKLMLWQETEAEPTEEGAAAKDPNLVGILWFTC